MSEAEKKIKNIFTYLIPSGVSNILPFLTFPIITRFLTPQDYGISALAVSTSTLFAGILCCNIDSAAQRYYFEYRKDSKKLSKLINTSLLFMFGVFGISLFIWFFIRGYVSKIVMGSDIYSFPFLIAYIGSFVNILVNFYLLLYRNMEKAKEYSFYMTFSTVINAVLTLFLVAVLRAGYMGIIYGALISQTVILVLLFSHFITAYPPAFSFKMLKDNLVYGVPLIAGTFTGSIYQFFDKFMLSRFVSLYSTGLFSIGQNISNRMFVFMTSIQATFHPIFMREMFDNGVAGAKAVGRNFSVFTYLSFAAILPAVLFGEEIISILAPKSYGGAIDVFMVLLGAIATQTFGKIVGAQLAYIKKAYLNFPITVVGVIVNVGLNILLIPRFHAAGAALATLATTSIMNYVFVSIAQRDYKIKYEKGFLSALYANLIISMFLLVLMRSYGVFWLFKYAVKLASIAMFVIAGKNAGIVSKKNIWVVMKIFTFKKTAEMYVEV